MVIGCQGLFCNHVKLTMKLANKMVTSSVCVCVCVCIKSGQQVFLNVVFLHVVLNTICASCPSIHWLSLSSSCFFCLQREKLIKCQMHPSILSVWLWQDTPLMYTAYHRGCRDRDLCRSPRSGTDRLAFEACRVGATHHADLNPPLTTAQLWILQYGLSLTPRCL